MKGAVDLVMKLVPGEPVMKYGLHLAGVSVVLFLCCCCRGFCTGHFKGCCASWCTTR